MITSAPLVATISTSPSTGQGYVAIGPAGGGSAVTDRHFPADTAPLAALAQLGYDLVDTADSYQFAATIRATRYASVRVTAAG